MPQHPTPPLAVAWDPGNTANNPTLQADARFLADNLGVGIVDLAASRLPRFLLTLTGERLELRAPNEPRTRPIYVDLTKHDTTSPAGRRKKQPLAKAVGLSTTSARRQHVLDATAGYGQDTWLLASFGCRVTAFERSPVVAALLQDGLRRASGSHPDITARIEAVASDAHDWIIGHTNAHRDAPDVIYLDPIFPPTGSSALNRRPMRILRELVGQDLDAARLLDAARQTARRRVVVKRPTHAEPLADDPTTTHHAGRAVRYDVYVTPARRR